MNKSHRKFDVGDFVYVVTINKYGQILEVSKTPSGRTVYRLDIDNLLYFEEEFEPATEFELVAKKNVETITEWGKKWISDFGLAYRKNGTIEITVNLVNDPSEVEDEYAEPELIRTLSKLMQEKDMRIVRRRRKSNTVVWKLKKQSNNVEVILNSVSSDAEIVALKSLMDHYLDRLHTAKTEQEKEQFKQILADIVDRLKQLEYF